MCNGAPFLAKPQNSFRLKEDKPHWEIDETKWVIQTCPSLSQP